jgi:hypothetical protein
VALANQRPGPALVWALAGGEVPQVEQLAVEVGRAGAPHGPPEGCDVVEQRDPTAVVDRGQLERGLRARHRVPGADAEHQSALGEPVDGGYLLRGRHRLAVGRDHRGGAESHSAGRSRGDRESGERFEAWTLERLARPQRIEAEVLGTSGDAGQLLQRCVVLEHRWLRGGQ